MNVLLVTLGCTKNQVDSEMILGLFKERGYTIVTDKDIADVVIVNTCGFIESAKKEAIDTIFEMADLKVNAICKHLIVTGCLAKRYKNEILELIPEVDLVIGVDEYNNIDRILSTYFNQEYLNLKLDFKKRIVSSNFPLAYVRISDGCDNRCHFCAIPSIRGRFISRKIEDIVEEVKMLTDGGMQEICLISQDTSKYGLDIYKEYKLVELIQEISKNEKVKWIRLLYMYPGEVTDRLINEVKNNKKVCKYFDIPIQHISNEILKNMNRHDTKEQIIEVIKKIRKEIPSAIIRTTVIVGYPGETEENFNELKEVIKKLEFEKLGAFMYSQEEGTVAAGFENQILKADKKRRYDEILKIQQEISYKLNLKKIGKIYEVVVENISKDEKYFICRSYMDAPDVDGRILVKITDENIDKIIVGGFINVKVIFAKNYDLFANIV